MLPVQGNPAGTSPQLYRGRSRGAMRSEGRMRGPCGNRWHSLESVALQPSDHTMPTIKPRIKLTLEPHRYDLIKRLAAAQGVSMASVVTDIMDEVYPVLERVCIVLEAAKQAQETGKQGLRDAVAQAEADLVPFLYQAVDQLDIFMEDAAKKVGVDLAPDTRASEAIRKAQEASQSRQQIAGGGDAKSRTPRHVIRGSGSQKRGG